MDEKKGLPLGGERVIKLQHLHRLWLGGALEGRQ